MTHETLFKRLDDEYIQGRVLRMIRIMYKNPRLVVSREAKGKREKEGEGEGENRSIRRRVKQKCPSSSILFNNLFKSDILNDMTHGIMIERIKDSLKALLYANDDIILLAKCQEGLVEMIEAVDG